MHHRSALDGFRSASINISFVAEGVLQVYVADNGIGDSFLSGNLLMVNRQDWT